jgi:imidazolonepropionase-like amidohydrolase
MTGNRDNAVQGVSESFPPGLPENEFRIEGQYQKAGARYLVGSGTDAFGTLPGISFHTELKLLTRVGLSPRQALAAATSNFGELLGWKNVGQAKAGYNADLLVLDEDPVKDISNLKKISMVILNGKILNRDKLLSD